MVIEGPFDLSKPVARENSGIHLVVIPDYDANPSLAERIDTAFGLVSSDWIPNIRTLDTGRILKNHLPYGVFSADIERMEIYFKNLAGRDGVKFMHVDEFLSRSSEDPDLASARAFQGNGWNVYKEAIRMRPAGFHAFIDAEKNNKNKVPRRLLASYAQFMAEYVDPCLEAGMPI